MKRRRGLSAFDECRVEIRRMFAGEITGEELARRTVEIAKRHGIDLPGMQIRARQLELIGGESQCQYGSAEPSASS
jgi:protein-tyrosine-phosphatase